CGLGEDTVPRIGVLYLLQLPGSCIGSLASESREPATSAVPLNMMRWNVDHAHSLGVWSRTHTCSFMGRSTRFILLPLFLLLPPQLLQLVVHQGPPVPSPDRSSIPFHLPHSQPPFHVPRFPYHHRRPRHDARNSTSSEGGGKK
ncbi:hypothetical protein GBAR_LOCUS5973, partial [Geodia barretti]